MHGFVSFGADLSKMCRIVDAYTTTLVRYTGLQARVTTGSQLDGGPEPCPYRIINDVGGAFGMGAVEEASGTIPMA